MHFFIFAHVQGSEPKELLMELKLLTEVLDHLEPSLTGLGTQV